MIKKIILLALFIPNILISKDFILVKQVWGDVTLIKNSENHELLSFSTIEKDEKIKLNNASSKLWLKDNNDNNYILQYSQNKNVYSHNDLVSLLKDKKKPKEDKSVNKFLSLISYSNNKKNKINGMLLSPRTGISRNIKGKEIIILDDLYFIKEFPAKISFANLIDPKIKSSYIIKIISSTNLLLFEKETSETDLIVNIDSLSINPFSTIFKLEIIERKTNLTFRTNLKAKVLPQQSEILLDELKGQATKKNIDSENIHQAIFLEYLKSNSFIINYNYYTDLFENNEYQINE